MPTPQDVTVVVNRHLFGVYSTATGYCIW